MSEKVDAIVVGAGPAGSAAAYAMAKNGLKTVLIEKGREPGAKNMMGGVLYCGSLNDLIPNFWQEAPVERPVTRNIITFLTEDSSLSIDFKTQKFHNAPYNSFTVLRAKFDKWFASKAEEKGATLIPGIRVDELLTDGNKVCGVVAGEDRLTADVVIAADGANSFLARKAGLGKDLLPEEMAVGVKEVIEIPKDKVEERFNLSEDEGAAQHFVGDCTKGIQGGGFIYTNKTSISLGLVVHLDGLMQKRMEIYELLDSFKGHPTVKELVKGGNVVEYSAHLVPEGGLDMVPRLYSDGLLVVGDAAGLAVNNGITTRGMDFAIASGVAAAESVKNAFEKKDFSGESLSHYETLLRNSFVLKDLHTFKGAPKFLKNLRIYSTYPQLICNMLERLYRVDGTPKKKMWKEAREAMKYRVSLCQLISDAVKGVRAL